MVAVGDGDLPHRPPRRSRRCGLSRTGLLPKVGRDRGWGLQCRPVLDPCKSSAFEACGFPVLCPEHAAPPSLPSAAPLPSTPSAAAHHSLVRALHRYYERVRLLIRSLTDCPLGFPPRPGIARTRPRAGMRSPQVPTASFRAYGVFDHGRASAPRKTARHILPSAVSTDSASARLALSRLNNPPHTIAVYASRRSSPSAPQHSLPERPLRLTRAGLAPAGRRQLRLAHLHLFYPDKGARRPLSAS